MKSFLLQQFRFLPSAAFAIGIALSLAGCVSEPSAVTGEKKAFGYSWEQEVQLGAEADKEITAEMGLYEAPEIQTYVESIGRRVLEASDLRDPNTPELYRGTKFTFRVLNSPVVNAFALPGGYVYVTRGLLTHVQNEAQLAVVLGHEIAHVAARHSSQQALKAQLGQVGLLAGAILGQQVLGGAGQDVASQILNVGGQAFQLLMFRYSREHETESDNLGVRYAAEAGYATAESAKFFQSLQRISQSEGRALPTWQSTHPDPGDRARRVVELSASWQPIGGAERLVGEEQFLRQLEGVVLGEDPREGFVERGVFYHPGLKFQFAPPPGWKLQNERAVVIMIEPNQRAVLGLQIVPATSAHEAAERFARESGVQVISTNDARVNGLPAITLLGRAATEQGTIGLSNAFVEFEGKVYSFLGYASAQLFAAHQPTFASVVSGFAPLTDPKLLGVEPMRVRVVTAERSAPFHDFVPTSLPATLTPQQLAIINQVTLEQTIPVGKRLKLPALRSDPRASRR